MTDIDARNELFGKLLLASAHLPLSSSIPIPPSTLCPARWTESLSPAAPSHNVPSSSSGFHVRTPSQLSLRFSTTFATVQADDNGDFELLPASFSRKEQAPTSTADRAPPLVRPRAPSVVVEPRALSPERLIKRASETVIMSPEPQRQRLAPVAPISQDGDVSMADVPSTSAPIIDSASASTTVNSGKSTIIAVVPAAHLFNDDVPVIPSQDDSIMDLTQEEPTPKFSTIDLDAHLSSDEDANNIKSLLNDDDLSSTCSP
ncbi:hypothetical protein HYPSUDRAFT_210022 [Hypholoma sublateritium FD-334 SS-4]|uniref:Uncharacterized protein n=1 Tax=Hypholoma sublateritium (strain FD-334 SS-4) TaxID=945553 RepID=A0A0D2N112_HYPSF|nr:hypothetical protein HYPSUDRAFT_210022 [Hypholoma sublateritium FD-334 SS-4]